MTWIFRIAVPLMVSALVFTPAVLEPESTIGSFLLDSWYIQLPNTVLFGVGLWAWLRRAFPLFRAQHLVARFELDEDLGDDDVETLLHDVPSSWPETLSVRRLLRLLEESEQKRDPRIINEVLAKRDARTLEQGHLVVDSLKSVIPVVGFLGTVVGLSLAMLAFPEVAEPDKLRAALGAFSRSLSLAFNTTMLALIYTVILILLTTIARASEQRLLESLDRAADHLVKRLPRGLS